MAQKYDPNIEKLRKSLQGVNETPPRPSVQMDGHLYYKNHGATNQDQWNKIHYQQLENIELHMQKINDRLNSIMVSCANLHSSQDNMKLINEKLDTISEQLTESKRQNVTQASSHQPFMRQYEFFPEFNFSREETSDRKCSIEEIAEEITEENVENLTTPSPIDTDSSDPYKSAIEDLRAPSNTYSVIVDSVNDHSENLWPSSEEESAINKTAESHADLTESHADLTESHADLTENSSVFITAEDVLKLSGEDKTAGLDKQDIEELEKRMNKMNVEYIEKTSPVDSNEINMHDSMNSDTGSSDSPPSTNSSDEFLPPRKKAPRGRGRGRGRPKKI